MTTRTAPDYTPYLKHAREQAWVVARQIADFLREKYHPTRIAAFGSIVHPEVFGLHSDIDIAVDGIPWPDYLRAWNDVEERFPEFKVDLIDVGIVSEGMRERIEEEGEAL